MRYAFDLDGTLCTIVDDANYGSAQPIIDRIRIVNELHAAGHDILIYTARGSLTGIDWRELTEEQLSTWGVQYTELRLDKPHFDLLVDDKACDDRTFFRSIRSKD